MSNEKTLMFSLTVQDANVILGALAKLPFEVVYELINKLNSQATEQLKEKEENVQ